MSASRTIVVLLATAAGALSAAILSPLAGGAWGLITGSFLTYPRLRVTLGLPAVRVIASCCVGYIAVRLYIDAVAVWWASALVFGVAAAIQFALLAAPVPRWLRRERPGSHKRQSLAHWCFVTIALIGTPLSLFVAWHGEVYRRIRVIEKGGGSVSFEKNTVLGDLVRTLRKGEVRMNHLIAFESERQQVIRELAIGTPVREVVLHYPTLHDLRTIRPTPDLRQPLKLCSGGLSTTTVFVGSMPPLLWALSVPRPPMP